MSLTPMALKERFAHRPLVPDPLAKQRSIWRQRWGLPPREVHASSTDWKYYIDPAEIVGYVAPSDPRLRLRHALRQGSATGKYFVTGGKGAGKSTTAFSLWQDAEILGNVKILDRPDGQLQDEGLGILREFINSRLDGAPLDTYLDFSGNALDRVFYYSCGNFRELCRILQNGFETADILSKRRADTACFETALRQLRSDYNPFLQRYRPTLEAVRHNAHSRSDFADLERDDLGRLIQSLAVVEYPDDPGWLDVHPIIQDLMDDCPSTLVDSDDNSDGTIH
ncbi:MAG: hypothetical protein MJE77_01975 [Proteobacteria bacterium]|nr:hypothetical protein [Pseudomonadota bacterium]